MISELEFGVDICCRMDVLDKLGMDLGLGSSDTMGILHENWCLKFGPRGRNEKIRTRVGVISVGFADVLSCSTCGFLRLEDLYITRISFSHSQRKVKHGCAAENLAEPPRTDSKSSME